MDPTPLFLLTGLCLVFTLTLFFLREQVAMRSLAARNDDHPSRSPATPSES